MAMEASAAVELKCFDVFFHLASTMLLFLTAGL